MNTKLYHVGIIHVHRVTSFAWRTTNNALIEVCCLQYLSLASSFPIFLKLLHSEVLIQMTIHRVFVPDSKASPKSFHERTTFCFRFYSHSFQSLWCRKQNISYGDKLKVELCSQAISSFQTNWKNMCVVSYMYNLLDYILLNLNRCNCTQHSST